MTGKDRWERVYQTKPATKVSCIVATFAEDGPVRCSGLDIVRYRPETLHAEFGPAFSLEASEREEHQTPGGSGQRFIYCYCRR